MSHYISLKEATEYCNYSQDYLKLRARQGKLKAVKIGRNWVTTPEWVEEYSRNGKGQNIKELPKIKEIRFPQYYIRKSDFLKFKKIILGLVVISIIAGVLLNFDIFTEYLQWQTANIGGIFGKGLEIIPGRIIEIK